MTHLTTYADRAPHGVLDETGDFDAIARRLAPLGVGLERWRADRVLARDADDAAVLEAYAAPVAGLRLRYPAADVIRLLPDHPQGPALRGKFLDEHTHADDEVRFFVEGSGLFYIRGQDEVHALECTAGDLIVLPAGLRHWFDMGPRPHFTAIRLFTTPEGWVADFTGDPLARAIPLYAGAA
jgi:1,2-dihydroxy-3-keto-5-methylthiopentene dioxygenase